MRAYCPHTSSGGLFDQPYAAAGVFTSVHRHDEGLRLLEQTGVVPGALAAVGHGHGAEATWVGPSESSVPLGDDCASWARDTEGLGPGDIGPGPPTAGAAVVSHRSG